MNIAILGLGKIAHRVAKGIAHAKGANLYAVASRDEQKAKQFAAQYQVAVHYHQYASLLVDEKVDVVYICTPNQLHYAHIMDCLKHRKHVICEKPLVAHSEQVKSLFAYAKKQNCFLMEAEKTVFTPLNQKLKQMVDTGVIGRLLSIKADYAYQILAESLPREHWVFDDTYGGCSYDVGVYPIVFAHYYAQSPIHYLHTVAIQYQDYRCDFGMDAIIEYENGITANVCSHWLHTCDQKGYGYLIGEAGYIEIPAYWKGKQATLYKNGKKEAIQVAMESDFTGQIEHALYCIKKGLLQSPMMGEQHSLQIMQVLKDVNKYRKEN